MSYSSSAQQLKIAAFGDSLMAGYELESDEGFVPQLEAHLQSQGFDVTILDQAVSGNTTADGLLRVNQVIAQEPDGVILALGANDMLRFIPPPVVKENLIKIITQLQENNIPILLCGLQSQLNWGPQYKKAFDEIYPNLAKEFNIPLYPFFLDGVALDPKLNIEDGLHPNPAGIAVIVKNISPKVNSFITEITAN